MNIQTRFNDLNLYVTSNSSNEKEKPWCAYQKPSTVMLLFWSEYTAIIFPYDDELQQHQ